MLPIGQLRPAPGWGRPRGTRLTHDEQRTLMTLWSMFRSPLMVGGDLTAGDPWTASLLTNPEVLAVDQHSTGNRQAIVTGNAVVWLAQPASGKGYYLAIFNLADATETLTFAWRDLGLAGTGYLVRDLWKLKDMGPADSIRVTLPSHGSVLYRVVGP